MLRRTVGSEQQSQHEASQGLKKLMVKCRWAGMEQDAETIRHKLEDLAPEDSIAIGPVETD